MSCGARWWVWPRRPSWPSGWGSSSRKNRKDRRSGPKRGRRRSLAFLLVQLFQMGFENLIDITGERSIILLSQLSDSLERWLIQRNTDFTLSGFIYLTPVNIPFCRTEY